jgi:pectate lyase
VKVISSTTTTLITTMVSFSSYFSALILNYYFPGINTRDGAQLLVENNVFVGQDKPLYSTDEGFAIANGNDFGDGTNTAPEGTLTSVPYPYTLLDVSAVESTVTGGAGATLSW